MRPRPLFHDRRAAGAALAGRLREMVGGARPGELLVLGIPRGGVVVAAEVARELGAELDVYIARKLGAPGHEELGIGAVAADGTRVLDDGLIRALRIPDTWIEEVTARERAELERRLQRFRGGRAPPATAGRTVLLVDDGLATGVTARAALAALRHGAPRQLVFAAPVCSAEGSAQLCTGGYADQVVCVATPDPFGGVGLWYEQFEQTTDAEVMRLLAEAGSRKTRDGEA